MPTWVFVVLAVVAVLAAGLLRERWRLSGVERWCQSRGFQLQTPFVPSDRPPMAPLALHFAPHGARLWGAAVHGYFDGTDVTIAEYETAGTGKTTGKWHTLLVWSMPGQRPAGVVRRESDDDWPYAGRFALHDDYGSWRTEGVMTAARLSALLEQLPAARARLIG